MTIITFDPSGSSTSATFIFRNWNNYQFISFNHSDWREHVQFFKFQINSIRKEEAEHLIIYENSNFCKGANRSFLELLRAVAGLSLFLYEQRIASCIISNRAVALAKKIAREGKIKGLERQRGKGWTFRGKGLANEHELDAFLIFWVYSKNKGEE